MIKSNASCGHGLFHGSASGNPHVAGLVPAPLLVGPENELVALRRRRSEHHGLLVREHEGAHFFFLAALQLHLRDGFDQVEALTRLPSTGAVMCYAGLNRLPEQDLNH